MATTKKATVTKKATAKKVPQSPTITTTQRASANPEAELFDNLVNTVRASIKGAEDLAKLHDNATPEGIQIHTKKAIQKAMQGHRWI